MKRFTFGGRGSYKTKRQCRSRSCVFRINYLIFPDIASLPNRSAYYEPLLIVGLTSSQIKFHVNERGLVQEDARERADHINRGIISKITHLILKSPRVLERYYTEVKMLDVSNISLGFLFTVEINCTSHNL